MPHSKKSIIRWVRGAWQRSACLVLVVLSACSLFNPSLNGSPASPNEAPPTLTPFQPLPAGTMIVPQDLSTLAGITPASPTPAQALPPAQEPTTSAPDGGITPPLRPLIWLDPALPPKLLESYHPPPEYAISPMAEGAALRLEIGTGNPLNYWIYALVAPFPSLVDEVSAEDLQRAWRAETGGASAGGPLLMDPATLAGLSAWWGAPAAGAVQVFPAQELLDQAWKAGQAWAIVPFEALEPRWKVLLVDGRSPVRKDFDPLGYALALPLSINGATELLATNPSALAPGSNRDPGKMTVVAMTGVTALVRATAYAMETQGVVYPARDIGALLADADIAHISNEVPFAEDCPFPDPVQPGMRFCSDTRYIKLMEAVGTDIVELTGDHFQDWGAQAMQLTLRMYQERGWPYYGGGANLDEARRAVTLTHNGNRLAFIGCNAKGGSFAQAGPNQPGAVACGYDWMAKEITRLRQEGYLPIATFQHFEYYTYEPQGDQRRDFRRMAEAGAVVVSGSQAHQPQAFEFSGQRLIHYGLGNMFFDQYDISLATRQGFIDRHIFYDGRYISTELLTHLFVDYARPRLMTRDEREDLLIKVFNASGW